MSENFEKSPTTGSLPESVESKNLEDVQNIVIPEDLVRGIGKAAKALTEKDIDLLKEIGDPAGAIADSDVKQSLINVGQKFQFGETVGTVYRWVTGSPVPKTLNNRMAGWKAFASMLEDELDGRDDKPLPDDGLYRTTAKLMKEVGGNGESPVNRSTGGKSDKAPVSKSQRLSPAPTMQELEYVQKKAADLSRRSGKDEIFAEGVPVSKESHQKMRESFDEFSKNQDRLEEATRNARWKITPDRFNRDNAQEIGRRKDWLQDVLFTKGEHTDMETSLRRQRAWDTAGKHITNSLSGTNLKPTVLSRFLQKNPAIGRRAIELLHGPLGVKRNGKQNLSPMEFIRSTESPISTIDLKAVQLIGMALLEEGNAIQSGEVKFSEVPESTKQLIRLGEIIALEANRKQIDRAYAAGKLTRERALQEIKIYGGMKTSHDLPPGITNEKGERDDVYQKFANMERMLREAYGVPEKTRKPERIKEVKVQEKPRQRKDQERKTNSPERAKREPIPEATPVYEPPREAGVYAKVAKYLPSAGTPERKYADEFLRDEHFSDQVEYAEWVSKKVNRVLKWSINTLASIGTSAVLGAALFSGGAALASGGVFATFPAVAYWGWRKLRKMDYHNQIFGNWGGAKQFFNPWGANRDMAVVRGRVMNVFDRYKDNTGDNQFEQYERIFGLANAAELPEGQESTPEMEQVIQEDIADEPQATNSTGSEQRAPENSQSQQGGYTSSGEVIDMVLQPDGTYAPEGYITEPQVKKTAEQLSDDEFFDTLNSWQLEHPDADYSQWAAVIDKSSIQRLKQEAEERSLRPQTLWRRRKEQSLRKNAA